MSLKVVSELKSLTENKEHRKRCWRLTEHPIKQKWTFSREKWQWKSIWQSTNRKPFSNKYWNWKNICAIWSIPAPWKFQRAFFINGKIEGIYHTNGLILDYLKKVEEMKKFKENIFAIKDDEIVTKLYFSKLKNKGKQEVFPGTTMKVTKNRIMRISKKTTRRKGKRNGGISKWKPAWKSESRVWKCNVISFL